MPQPKQKRDNNYYLGRLKAEHPDVFDDFQKGKFKSADAAFIVAGLRKPKDGLKNLETAWRRATAVEKDAFKILIGCTNSTSGTSSITPASTTPSIAPIHRDRRLTPAAITSIQNIMDRRGLRIGQVTHELGFSPLNASLGNAISQGTRLQPPFLEALENWLIVNSPPA